MLFSSREVAEFISANFEPAWESLRPAPMVTIDFGNGETVKRTLHGNVATYVCNSDGIVCDILPGLYAPGDYVEQLKASRTVVDSFAKSGLEFLRRHHAERAAQLAKMIPTPQMQAIAQTGGVGKFGTLGGGAMPAAGSGVLGVLGAGGGVAGIGGAATPTAGSGILGNGGGVAGIKGGQAGQFGNLGGQFGIKGGVVVLTGIEGPTIGVIAGIPVKSEQPTIPLAAWPVLALDSQVNELIRRRAVHERLANSGSVRPDDLKKWLFKDVLHADLDDPLLGLGPVLNENYPFAAEDAARPDPAATNR